jgi:hypothetical protein
MRCMRTYMLYKLKRSCGLDMSQGLVFIIGNNICESTQKIGTLQFYNSEHTENRYITILQ